MHDNVTGAKQQNQHNHRRSTPDTKLWAAEALARCAGQQRRDNRRPDGCGQTGIADGIQETIGLQQAADDRWNKGQERGLKTAESRIIKTKQVRR